jgi:diacylglycerol kinase (ATP)
MERLFGAARNSARGWRFLMNAEASFRMEVAALALSLLAGWFLATSLRGYVLLIGAILALMIVEAINTAIEAACDAFSREFNTDIQHAKDCGSLAVALTMVIAVTIWGLAVWERFFAA